MTNHLLLHGPYFTDTVVTVTLKFPLLGGTIQTSTAESRVQHCVRSCFASERASCSLLAGQCGCYLELWILYDAE